MTVNGAAAAAWMYPGRPNEDNACLNTVWQAYGSPHTIGRLPHHTFGTAIEAYNYTTKRHTDRNPPEGAAVWFGACSGPRYAGDEHWRDGDVTVARKGILGATDYKTFGHIGECTIAEREAQTGRKYAGWTEDIFGHDIILGATAAPHATPLATTEEDTMKLNAIRNHDGSIGLIDEGGLLYPISDEGLWNCYLRLGIVQQQPDGTFFLQQTDGTVWNALSTRTARVLAARSSADPKAIAASLAPLLIPTITTALGEAGSLTAAQVEAATQAAIKAVFADAAK